MVSVSNGLRNELSLMLGHEKLSELFPRSSVGYAVALAASLFLPLERGCHDAVYRVVCCPIATDYCMRCFRNGNDVQSRERKGSRIVAEMDPQAMSYAFLIKQVIFNFLWASSVALVATGTFLRPPALEGNSQGNSIPLP